MNDIVNYGLIGTGMMGQEHLRNLALIPGARIAAIFDPDAAMAAAASALAPEATTCATLDDLLAHAPLDALVVASPNHRHASQLARIAARRPLPLMMEKPLFTDADQGATVARIAAKYPAPIWVAMEYRYMPPVQALLDRMDAVTGGIRMLTIREHRYPFLTKVGDWNRFDANTGGTLVEKCCHFFDLMRLILKSDPVRIMASGGQEVNHRDERIGDAVPDVWDSAYAIVDFASGARAMLELCMFAEGATWQEEICAVGPVGRIDALIPGPGRFWPAHLGSAPVPRLVISPRAPKGPNVIDIPIEPSLLAAGDHNGSTYYQHLRFNAVVRGQGPVEVGVHEGAMAVSMGLAAQRSAREGRAIAL